MVAAALLRPNAGRRAKITMRIAIPVSGDDGAAEGGDDADEPDPCRRADEDLERSHRTQAGEATMASTLTLRCSRCTAM